MGGILGSAWEALNQPSVALVASTLVAFVVFGALMSRQGRLMQRESGLGIVEYELARTAGQSEGIIRGWGDRGRVAATKSLFLDYVWLTAYTALLVMSSLRVQEVLEGRTAEAALLVASIAPSAAVASVLAGALDAVENTILLWQLHTRPSPVSVVVARFAALLKFLLVGVVVVLCLVGLAFSLMLS